MATESQSISLGVACPEFLLRGTDHQIYSLESYKDCRILVIGFTCNHCPYVQAYEQRLNALAKSWKQRSVAFVCINANDSVAYPEDSFEKMVERATKNEFVFDYLRDDSQEVARAFNAACTPEFYVYDEKRLLRYHGRFDDSPKDPRGVKIKYLENAIVSLCEGKDPQPHQTSAIGCSIKWKSQL